MAPPTGAAGRFVTIEGGEGTGKTTLLAALAERARSGGLDVVTCREPGGTALGERLRTALLGADGAAPDPRAELLVFAAARAQLVAEVIRPALERGALVLCDRYADSTTAYQHHGRGLPRETVDAVNAAATGGLTPDLTLLLDLPADEGLRRAGRAGDYMEREARDASRSTSACARGHVATPSSHRRVARMEPTSAGASSTRREMRKAWRTWRGERSCERHNSAPPVAGPE